MRHLLFVCLCACLSLTLTSCAIHDADSTANTSTNSIITSPNDYRQYQAITLENGLQVLLISDPKADKAAASLDVSVGSGDDPDSRPGLAHFLEHMLFLGTEKYPHADAYQSFISKHGGNHNAYTSTENTNYYFGVDNQFFAEALDRFSGFFIAPTFTPEYVDREMNAVHSEYQSKLQDDGRRYFAVLKQILNPEHPMAGFAVGSLDTLADRPEDPIREDLLAFYKQHYSADKMSLVLIGAYDLDQLKQLAVNNFSAIKNQHLPATHNNAPLFKDGTLPALLSVKSIKEGYSLNLSFPTPSIEPYYRQKPLNYISALLGHEGEGSLLQQLKQLGWANSLSAGPSFSNESNATLSVSIGLTPLGYEHYQEVVALSFAYIDLLKKEGVQQWIYEEEKLSSDIQFRFQEPGDATHYATRLSNNLKHYPTAEVVHGDYLYDQYDPALINDFLSYLTTRNVLISLSSQDIATDQVEPWYQVPYSLKALEPASIASWGADVKQQAMALHLPAPNPFLATDFSLKSGLDQDIPEVLIDQPGYRLWFKQDQDFNTPRADFYFTFRSPVANNNARNYVLTQLYVELVKDELNSFTYPANTAGFDINLYDHLRGFSLRLSGFRDKQPLLLEHIVANIKNLEVQPDRLDNFKAELKRALENTRKAKPYNQTLDAVYKNLLNPQWTVDEQLAVIDDISAAELQKHAQTLLQSGELEALAHGSLDADDAKKLSAVIETQLLTGLDIQTVKPAWVTALPEGRIEQVVPVEHTDAGISLYLQAVDQAPASRAQLALLGEFWGPRFYNELRTEKQLGYVVFATAMPILEQPGVGFIIQSPVASGPELEQYINDYIQQSLNELKQLSDAELARYKQSVMVNLLEADKKLTERSNRYWQEIDRGYTEFDSREQRASAVEKVSKEDLLQAYQSIIKRRLVVWTKPQN